MHDGYHQIVVSLTMVDWSPVEWRTGSGIPPWGCNASCVRRLDFLGSHASLRAPPPGKIIYLWFSLHATSSIAYSELWGANDAN